MSIRLGNLLTVLGVAACIVATAWWIVFFYDILGADFQVARECFYATTNLCSLRLLRHCSQRFLSIRLNFFGQVSQCSL